MINLSQTWSGPISKRVVIVHGWADDPTKGWIHWLAQELEARDIKVQAPHFTEPRSPELKVWMDQLRSAIGQPDPGLVLVGHSLGCTMVLRAVSDWAPSVRIAGIVLVAGMVELKGWKPPALFVPPLDYAKIQQIATKRICIYSDDDERVKPELTKAMAKLLNAEEILDPGKGHFAGLHGCSELPSALQAVLSCYKN